MRGFSLFLALARSLSPLPPSFLSFFFLAEKKGKEEARDRRSVGGERREEKTRRKRLSFLYSIQKAGMAER